MQQNNNNNVLNLTSSHFQSDHKFNSDNLESSFSTIIDPNVEK